MSLKDDVEFVAFDLETTGLSPTFDRIVEFGAVRFRADGTEIDRFDQLVDPRCRIPSDAARVHGITDRMVRGKPTIEEVLPGFLQFIGTSDTILLAHNASFDVRFLSTALDRCLLAVPASPVVDTLRLSRRRLSQLRSHSLPSVASHLRIADSTAHRALADALVVESLFLKFLAQAPVIGTVNDLFNVAPPLRFKQTTASPLTTPAGHERFRNIEMGQQVSIIYGGGTKGQWRRQVTPRHVIEIKGSFYLVAHCHIDGMEKHFRLDRIVEIEKP